MIENKSNPLVSILIPTYNRPHYFKIALESALNQTYENLEIIICDDSTNNDTRDIVEPYLNKYTNIKYYNNGGPLGLKGTINSQRCLELASGEYINYLHDDDMFHPDKIRRMMGYFCEDENVSMVASRRVGIDANTEQIQHIPLEELRVKRMKGNEVIKSIFHRILNIIGEPTVVLFKKKYTDGYGVFQGKEYIKLDDVATWLALCSKGDCVYINESLSYIRNHEGRNSKRPSRVIDAYMEWIYLIENAYEAGFMSKKEYIECVEKWKNRYERIFNIIEEKSEYLQYKEYLRKLKII